MTQLMEYASVVLDAAGNGRVAIGPRVVREQWKPSQATVSVSTQVLEARCSIYLGVSSVPGQKLGESRTGSSGDTYGFGSLVLQPGQHLMAVWVGGDPGAIATIAVFGEKDRPK